MLTGREWALVVAWLVVVALLITLVVQGVLMLQHFKKMCWTSHEIEGTSKSSYAKLAELAKALGWLQTSPAAQLQAVQAARPEAPAVLQKYSGYQLPSVAPVEAAHTDTHRQIPVQSS